MKNLNIIVAYSQNRCIGKDNKLLWHLADDMAFFKKMTTNQIVIMGRKTYESLPERFRPLPNRINIVLSRQANETTLPDLHFIKEIDQSFEICDQYPDREAFIIGGGQIYASLLPQVDTIFATEVQETFDGDTFFPTLLVDEWQMETVSVHDASDKNEFAFEIKKYTRFNL